MIDVGASGELISALKAKKNVLTALQKIAYDEQQTEHRQQVQADTSNRMRAAAIGQAEQQQELQRRKYYQQQTLSNIQQKEQQQAQYEQADRSYKYQRQNLEQNIQYLENNINRRRGHGATENDLRAEVQTLDRYKEQLRNFAPPMRPL